MFVSYVFILLENNKKLFFYNRTCSIVSWIIDTNNTPARFCSASIQYSSTFDLVIKHQYKRLPMTLISHEDKGYQTTVLFD